MLIEPVEDMLLAEDQVFNIATTTEDKNILKLGHAKKMKVNMIICKAWLYKASNFSQGECCLLVLLNRKRGTRPSSLHCPVFLFPS